MCFVKLKVLFKNVFWVWIVVIIFGSGGWGFVRMGWIWDIFEEDVVD